MMAANLPVSFSPEEVTLAHIPHDDNAWKLDRTYKPCSFVGALLFRGAVRGAA